MVTNQSTDFETLMALGVATQAAGEHTDALEHRLAAANVAKGDVQRARAFRDCSASYGHLDYLHDASVMAIQSVRLLEEGGVDETRELGASHDRLGRVQALARMQAEKYGVSSEVDPTVPFDLAKQELSPRDQYYVNMIGRSAIAHALYGSRRTAILDTVRAARSIPRSEKISNTARIAVAATLLSVTLGKKSSKNRTQTRRFALAERLMK